MFEESLDFSDFDTAEFAFCSQSFRSGMVMAPGEGGNAVVSGFRNLCEILCQKDYSPVSCSSATSLHGSNVVLCYERAGSLQNGFIHT